MKSMNKINNKESLGIVDDEAKITTLSNIQSYLLNLIALGVLLISLVPLCLFNVSLDSFYIIFSSLILL